MIEVGILTFEVDELAAAGDEGEVSRVITKRKKEACLEGKVGILALIEVGELAAAGDVQ